MIWRNIPLTKSEEACSAAQLGRKKGRAQRRIDRRRSRITKRFHRWREFPSFIGSSLKRISGKSHSGLMGDDRGRQARPSRIRRRARRRTKTVSAVVRYFLFFLLFLKNFSSAFNKLRSSTEVLYVIHIFSGETRSGVSGKAGTARPCSVRETTTLRVITCKILMRLRFVNWILRNEREFQPRLCRSFYIFQNFFG